MSMLVKVTAYLKDNYQFNTKALELKYDFPAYCLTPAPVIFSGDHYLSAPINTEYKVVPAKSHIMAMLIGKEYLTVAGVNEIAAYIYYSADSLIKELELPHFLYLLTMESTEKTIQDFLVEAKQFSNGGVMSPALYVGGHIIYDEAAKWPGPSTAFSELSKGLPGMSTIVKHPCDCIKPMQKGPLRDVIIHLNDSDKWTREKIADWLDELHDSGIINIEF